MLVNSLYNVIDRIFIGRGVGSEAIAGLTITFPVMNVASALGVLVGAGAAARVSIMLGSKDYRGAQLVLGNSLTLITINAAVYMTVFAIFMDQILRAFGASDQSLPYARDFLMYLLPGMFIMNLSFSFNNIMRASGYPVRAMVTMLIGTGFNVILAPIFIFALGWGIKGAAIATDIAMTISAVFVFAHFIKRDSILHFTRGVYKLRLPIVLSIISIGAAPSLVNAASSVINAIVNNQLVNHGGDSAVAAVGIFSTYTSLITMIVVGICQGMQPIVGYNYGAG
jgi:putative MATE family efflux protein